MSENISIKVSIALISLLVISLGLTVSSYSQTLYSCESPVGVTNPFLHIINPNNGATISTTEMVLSGLNVRGCNGMAKHPETGVCYVMVNVKPEDGRPIDPRILGIINPNTGAIQQIGSAEETFATLAFTEDGTLYGITGDGGAIPETLYTIDINNGSVTQVTPLGNGNDGETLAFNPVDQLLYHGSGNCLPNQIFESINPDNLSINPIPLSGDLEICEQSAMVYRSGNVFLSGTIDQEYYSITTGGVVTFLGDMDHTSKGLAFDCAAPPSNVPTLSEWGLIIMAGILGIIGFMVIQRRKLAA